MKRLLFTGLLFLMVTSLYGQAPPQKREPGLQYYNKDHFKIEGSPVADSLKLSPYDRLPASWKSKVREPVWELSRNSAGLSIRFSTNSTSIKLKWVLLNNNTMDHMASTGIKGADLYCHLDNQWRFVNTARPSGHIENEFLLVNHMPEKMREFKIFLPLYDGVTSLEVGIDSGSIILKPGKEVAHKPLVIYGTSITQGGCASRPGMAWTNVLSRKLNRECYNFGFSGNGRMEKAITELLCKIDASCFIIDCVPNMNAAQIRDSVGPLVAMIRQTQLHTPILFIEAVQVQKSFLDTAAARNLANRNQALQTAFRELVKNGFKDIYYIKGDHAIGDDHEGTVDGLHFTDLGFIRFAGYIESELKRLDLVR